MPLDGARFAGSLAILNVGDGNTKLSFDPDGSAARDPAAVARSQRYRERYPERVRAQRRAYRQKHAEILGHKTRQRNRHRREEAWAAVLAAFGGKCATCGFSDPRALQIDHVNDDGYLDKWDRLDAVKFKRMVLAEAHTGRYQILCANCNWIKRHEHERQRREALDASAVDLALPGYAVGDRHFSQSSPESLSRGQHRYNAKLTEAIVREIRASAESALALGRRYSVDPTLIKRVRDRRAWKHVT